jgi:hypothetical protein
MARTRVGRFLGLAMLAACAGLLSLSPGWAQGSKVAGRVDSPPTIVTVEQPDAQRTRAELSELLQRVAGDFGMIVKIASRREASEAANRPMTAVQVVAFVCAICLLGWCLRAASTWLSPVFARIASGMADHAVLALAMAAVFFLVPAGVYLALGRE